MLRKRSQVLRLHCPRPHCPLPLPRAPGGPEGPRPEDAPSTSDGPSACRGVTALTRGLGLCFDFLLTSALGPGAQNCATLGLSSASSDALEGRAALSSVSPAFSSAVG